MMRLGAMSPLCIRQACRYANLVISACSLLSMSEVLFDCSEDCLFIDIGILVHDEVSHSEHLTPGDSVIPFEKAGFRTVPHFC